MKVSIQTLGSLGDVMPYLAIARALMERGHEVSVLAPIDYADIITAYGVTAAPSAPVKLADWMEEAHERGTLSGPVSLFRDWHTMISPHADMVMKASLEAADGADLVFANLICATGRVAAECLGLPLVLSALQPVLSPTTEVPCAMVLDRDLGGPVNRVSYGAVSVALGLTGQALARFRPGGGKGLPLLTQLTRHLGRPLPRITSVPSVLMDERPDDWDAVSHLTAYPAIRPQPGWVAPPELMAFLEAGSKPVFIGLGSMEVDDPAGFVAMAQEALVLAGERGLFARKLVEGTGARLAPQHGVVGFAPHDWLLPRCAAIAHHGGSGTLDTALRMGCAQIHLPQIFDQHWNSQRLHELDLAPKPVPGRKLSAERLAVMIREAVSAPMQARVRAAQAQAVRRDGALEAAPIIEEAFGLFHESAKRYARR
jgi:vancomycin aglycone glucosyltransferase